MWLNLCVYIVSYRLCIVRYARAILAAFGYLSSVCKLLRKNSIFFTSLFFFFTFTIPTSFGIWWQVPISFHYVLLLLLLIYVFWLACFYFISRHVFDWLVVMRSVVLIGSPLDLCALHPQNRPKHEIFFL